MCIAIHRKKDGVLSKKTLWTCWDNNPDGAGFMYAEDGKLIIHKGFFKFKPFWKAIRDLIGKENRELVIHFRIATSGKVDYDNCHPHTIHDGLAYVHNGIISELNDDKDTCDTIRFAHMLKELPEDFIHSKGIMDMIEMAVGHSKFVFMNNRGEVAYINESMGVETQGVWYSNTGFRYSRSVWKDDYDYGTYGGYKGYSHGFSGRSYSYSEPITKPGPSTSTALVSAETRQEMEECGWCDEDLEAMPSSMTFDTYQRYDGDFIVDPQEDEPDAYMEDEYGFTEYDYNMLAEEEIYWWREHPELLTKQAYADICEINENNTMLRFLLQAWLDLHEPNYDQIRKAWHQKKHAIKEVVNATTEQLTLPIKVMA